jgi:hypothetical protein
LPPSKRCSRIPPTYKAAIAHPSLARPHAGRLRTTISYSQDPKEAKAPGEAEAAKPPSGPEAPKAPKPRSPKAPKKQDEQDEQCEHERIETEEKEMTTIKSWNYKLILAIMAAALSLTLIAAGTLMLFTAESETATNTVTLGAAKIELQERPISGGAVIEDEDYKTIDPEGGDFTGLVFDDVVPGDKIDKYVRVNNAGNVDVFVYVKGELTATYVDAAGERVPLNFDDITDPEIAAQFSAIIDNIPLNKEWKATMTVPEGEKITGIYYYGEYDEDATTIPPADRQIMTSLVAGEATTGIFPADAIEIPLNTTNVLKDYRIELKLTAYAVQSANHDYTTLGAIRGIFDAEGKI